MDIPKQEPQPPQDKTYKVVKNDTLIGIAKKFAHNDWKTVWNHPPNSGITSKRGKPELIQPGDVFIVPPSEKEFQEYEEAKRKFEEAFEQLKQEITDAELKIRQQLQGIAQALEHDAGLLSDFWDAVQKLKDDSLVVGWLLKNLPGMPQFPEVGLVKQAESLAKALASASDKAIIASLDAVDAAYTKAQEALVDAGDTIRDFLQKALGDSKFLKTSSFTIYKHLFEKQPILATASTILLSPPGMVAFIELNKAVEALGRIYVELAKISLDKAAQTEAALTDAAVEFARRALANLDDPEFIRFVAKNIQAKISVPGFKITNDHVEKWLAAAGAPALREALKGLGGGLKADASLDSFVAKVAEKIAPDFPAKGLREWIDKNIGQKSYALLKSVLPKGMSFNDYTKMAGPIYSPLVVKLGQQVLDKNIAKAKSAVEMGEEIVEVIARHSTLKGPLLKALDVFQKLKDKLKR